MINYKKSKEVAVAFNYIPTGDKEKVRGQKRMLAEKKKPATWY
jgi:hypothetical protein